MRILTITAGLLENTENKADATDVIKVLKSAAKLIKNLEPAGWEKQETKIDKATGTDTWTKKPSENENTGNVNPIEPGATIEEIWGHGSMATPDPPVATAGSPKPAEDDSDEPMDAPDPRILHILRAGQRRHPCRRGNCMTLQAPRRRRGRRVVTKLKNRDTIIKAYFKNRGGRHGDVGRPRQPPPIEQNQADWTYDPGLRHKANNKSREVNQDTKTDEKEEPGNHGPLTTPPKGPWPRNMPNYGQLRRNPGTNTVHLETKNMNLEVKTKIDGRTEDCAPPKDTSTKNLKPNATREKKTDLGN